MQRMSLDVLGMIDDDSKRILHVVLIILFIIRALIIKNDE